MTYRVRNIGIAVALAAVAALMTSFYVTNYKRHVQRGEDHVTVLVAKNDIPAGTAGSDAAANLTPTEVPRRAVVPGAISNPDELHNLVATEITYSGEQVTASRFGTPTELGVRAQLKANERAYQMEGSANELLAGTLQQGDHVDVVANWEAPEGASPPHHTAKVIVRNLLVLVAPEAPNSGGKLGESQSQFSVQLRATDEQVQKIFYARKNGDVSLILRPPADSQNSPRFVDDWRTLVGTR
jgi:Flp pilus assembly protein CpaB